MKMANRFLEKGPLSEAQEPIDLIEIISEDNNKQQGSLLEEYFEELIRYRNKIQTVFFIDTRYLQRHYDKKYSSKWSDEEPQANLFNKLKQSGILYKVYSWEEIYNVDLKEEQGKIEEERIGCLRPQYNYKKAEEEITGLIQSNAHYLENKLVNLAKQYQTKKDRSSAEKVAKEEAIVTLMLKGIISYPNKTLNPVDQCLIDKGINPDLKFHGRRTELLIKDKKKPEETFNEEAIAYLPKHSTFFLVTTCTAAVNQVVEKQRGQQLSDDELFKMQFLLKKFFIKSNNKKSALNFNSNPNAFFPSIPASNSDESIETSSTYSDLDTLEDNILRQPKNRWCNIL